MVILYVIGKREMVVNIMWMIYFHIGQLHFQAKAIGLGKI